MVEGYSIHLTGQTTMIKLFLSAGFLALTLGSAAQAELFSVGETVNFSWANDFGAHQSAGVTLDDEAFFSSFGESIDQGNGVSLNISIKPSATAGNEWLILSWLGVGADDQSFTPLASATSHWNVSLDSIQANQSVKLVTDLSQFQNFFGVDLIGPPGTQTSAFNWGTEVKDKNVPWSPEGLYWWGDKSTNVKFLNGDIGGLSSFLNPFGALGNFGIDPLNAYGLIQAYEFKPIGAVATPTAAFAALDTPEPATWAMMLLGFAGLGFLGYRKAFNRTLAA